MTTTTIVFRLGCALAVALAMSAAAHAGPCKYPGSPSAKTLSFDLADDTVLHGLDAAFQLGLSAAAYPAEQIRANASPCSRGKVGNFDVFGDDEDAPARWAIAPDRPGLIIFVTYLPRPTAARTTVKAGRTGGDFTNDQSMVALVAATADAKRRVYAFFDTVPDDATLKSLIADVASGKAHRLLDYDAKTHVVVRNPG